ncbi:MAG TPA: MerR family transcriptional regulator [Phototrophicaceae bacterium]|jgi:DNA-binding transcriptional MerR regulator|nr:MerR family transcriptional regulator [Phototrophicaceae bacterium]
MKTGEAAKILGVDAITVRRWIERDELKMFFSAGARGEHGAAQRLLTESDLLVLNTIRALRTNGNMEWGGVVVYLNTGQRDQEFPQNAIAVDPRTVPLPQAEQSARAMATLAERDAALRRVAELETRLAKAEHKTDEQNAEIIRLNREIGRLEGLIEAEKNRRGDRDSGLG